MCECVMICAELFFSAPARRLHPPFASDSHILRPGRSNAAKLVLRLGRNSPIGSDHNPQVVPDALAFALLSTFSFSVNTAAIRDFGRSASLLASLSRAAFFVSPVSS